MNEIDRRLCVSLMLVGGLSNYTTQEVQKYKDINYMLMTLQKKNFALRNGTAEQRLWANKSYALDQIKKSPKKKEQFLKKHKKAILGLVDVHNNFITHSKIADSAWKLASKKFPSTNAITVNQLVLALLRKDEPTMKYYNFNKKKLEKFAKSGIQGSHIFSSSRVATTLLEELSSEIAYYYALGVDGYSERCLKISEEMRDE